MFRKETASDRIYLTLVYTLCGLFLLIVAYPLWFVISSSISSPEEVMAGSIRVLPRGFSLEGYSLVFQNEDLIRGFRNTLLYTFLGTSINIVMTTLLAYPLSRKEMPGRRFVMLFVAFTMFFNGGLIPTYLQVEALGLVDTIWAMVIPTAISTFNMIIMRTYFMQSIPEELQESAFLDGCGYAGFLWHICLPLAKPVLAVLVLYYGVGHWNAYFNALIYLRSNSLISLQLALRQVLLANQISMGGADSAGFGERAMIGVTVKYAVIVVSSLPVLILYSMVQKFLVKGVILGALKG